MILNNKEEILDLTRAWKGERLPDGRPKVEEQYLEKLRTMTLEELWLPLYVKGYQFQFEGDFKILHPDSKLVGRAVTCTFVPARPDLAEIVEEVGARNQWEGMGNQWVIDNLVEGDVVVVDMYDKVYNGTFIGGNLTTAIAAHTKTGGAVIWGGIRDTEQMKKNDSQVYYRGTDPTPIRECLLTGYNTPCRIGKGICLPGDIVMGTSSGVLFIPSHLVAEVINDAEKTHARDIFGFEAIREGKYTTAQVDSSVWSQEMLEDMLEFINEDERCAKYRELDWSLELNAAKGDEVALKEVLKTCLR